MKIIKDKDTVEASVIRSCLYAISRRTGPMWASLRRQWRRRLRELELAVNLPGPGYDPQFREF